jgi:hydrogenase maturation protein HypF
MEYNNPMDRRFHAQPNACPVCGPSLTFIGNDKVISKDDPIKQLLDALRLGQIAAVKGIGGFHLVVDAKNDIAVNNLRKRKHRFEKPLALMVKNIDSAKKYVVVNEIAENLLSSLHRPIVLCRKNEKNTLSSEISNDNDYYGIMLPYSPFHELLFKTGTFDALVMTSANISEEPICYENQECVERMEQVADCFLIHDRGIYIRCDDSVLQICKEEPLFIRRSRGYSPRPIILTKEGSSVLAVGGHLKNTVCITRGNLAFMSQHIGDLENLQTLNAFGHTIEHLSKIYEIDPGCIIHDLHPEYLSTKWAQERENLPKKAIQHHYAHILSVMAEHTLEDDVIGIALDGTGYGEDGAIWGGEVMVANNQSFKRTAHFEYLPMPGGEKAIMEPWRMAVSYLDKYMDDGREIAHSLFESRSEKLKIVFQAIDRSINTPQTSSCGRLFDAVAAILGIRNDVAYEGQAAILLESHATKLSDDEPNLGSFELIKKDDQYVISPNKIIQKIVELRRSNRDIPGICIAFHMALVGVFTQIADRVRSQTSINQVALSGGCFQNMLLLKELSERLEDKGFTVLTNKEVPVNDGGLSLGQAYWGMHNT